MSILKTFNSIAVVLFCVMLGMLLFNVLRAAGAEREGGQKALEEVIPQYADYFSRIHEHLAPPESVDPDNRKLLEALLADAEHDLADYEKKARVLEHFAVFRVLANLNQLDRETEEFIAARKRLDEHVELLSTTYKEARAGRENGEGTCYCTCTSPGSPPALRGHKTPGDCRTLCGQEGFTSATCP